MIMGNNSSSSSSSRLWMNLAGSCVILAIFHVVSSGAEEPTAITSDQEAGRQANPVYYAQMWYRLWQFPLMMTLKWTVILALVAFSFGSSAIQGLGYYKSAPEHNLPIVIDGHIESYGNPWSKFFG